MIAVHRNASKTMRVEYKNRRHFVFVVCFTITTVLLFITVDQTDFCASVPIASTVLTLPLIAVTNI